MEMQNCELEKMKFKRYICDYDLNEILGDRGSLLEIIEGLFELFENLKKDGYSSITYKTGSNAAILHIHGYKEQTEEQIKHRLQYQKNKEEEERQLYEELRAKFENS